MNIRLQARQAKAASRHLSLLSAETKNEMLIAIAGALKKGQAEILKANQKDLAVGREKGLSEGLIDRLLLDEGRLKNIIHDLLKVVELEDPVGEILEEKTVKSGLNIQRVRVPLGVVGIIYEARPNVTVDAIALCLKSGNAVMLKGGSDALFSNRAIVQTAKKALAVFDGLNEEKPLSHAVQFIDSTDRKDTLKFLQLKGLIDVMIPRGSRSLINFVAENSTVPVIETGASVVHTFVDEFADVKQSVAIVINAKLRRTSICNTLDVALVHQKVADQFLKALMNELLVEKKSLEIRGDALSYKILKNVCHGELVEPRQTVSFDRLRMTFPSTSYDDIFQHITLKKAAAKDFDTEFLAPILAVKIVKSLDSAIEHIALHSLGHSEAILTENPAHAEKFLKEVDAACVYWNASTQFSDGAQFGLGAEIGISTQKLHARGPFALEALTSYKWIVRGSGQIRPV